MSFAEPLIPWPVDEMRERGLYFYEEATESYLPDNHVAVTGHGPMLMLGGYSYLGLIGDPRINDAAKAAIDQYGTGSQGVRILSGTLDIHKELDARIAEFKRADTAFTFSSGFATNVSMISALTDRHDVVFCDKLNHASIVDGCQITQADIVRFSHNDMNHLEHCLQKYADRKRKLVVVDAVFSMDGDIINLPELTALCKEHGAQLMVDEAHSIGVLGETGHGIEEHFGLPPDSVDIKMGTFSKAIPSGGGYVAVSHELADVIRCRARGYIYSGGLPAPAAAAAKAALDIIDAEPERVQKLQANAAHFRAGLIDAGLNFCDSRTPIYPILCSDDWLVLELGKYCRDRGIYVQAVLAPVVPKGAGRLRACVAANHNTDDLDYAVRVIREGAEILGILDRQERTMAIGGVR